jgi:hypothetical protein
MNLEFSTMRANQVRTLIAAVLVFGLSSSNVSVADDDRIDASDPTKIYTYAGGGLKYSEYTNGESMVEARVTGNLGLSDSDMILFEAGYGWHDGDRVAGANSGWTNARLRWFRVLNMAYDKISGYRGMSIQVDLQLEGKLKGTNGQNVLAVGIMPTYALGGAWNLYLGISGVAAWEEKFKDFSGAGVSVSPKLIYSPEHWWAGAQVQITPDYKYFLSGDLKGEGDGTLEVNLGGEFTPTIMWDIIAAKNFDIDLRSLQRGDDTGLKNDWNLFFNVTSYF